MDAEAIRSVHLRVLGRVQGVGFRWFVRVAARRLQLSGWVINRPDGSVEVAATGADDRLEELRRLLRRGPDGAKVAEVVEVQASGEELPFPFEMRK